MIKNIQLSRSTDVNSGDDRDKDGEEGREK